MSIDIITLMASKNYTDKQIKKAGGGGGGVSSWNDLTDKPFGDSSTGGDTLTWDGNTEGLVNVLDMLYKVSDAIVTIDDFANGWSCVMSDGRISSETAEYASELAPGVVSALSMFCVAESGVGVDLEGLAFPESGIYFVKMDGIHTTSVTIPGYTGFPSTKKLDTKYLPEHLQFGEKIVIDEVILKQSVEIGDEGYAELAINGKISEGKNYTVNLDGTTYECVAWYNEERDSLIIGNGSFAEADGLGEDVPFAIDYYSKEAFINMPNDMHSVHSVEVYREDIKIQKIDTKYLPEHLQFGEDPAGGDTLYWDGNADGKVVILESFVHVSDVVLTKSDFSNGAKVVIGENLEVLTIDEEDVIEGAIEGIGLMFGEVCFCINETEAEMVDVPAGVYFLRTDEGIYVSSLTIHGYTGFPVMKKIDPKYLPSAGGIKYVYINEDDDGNYTASATYDQITTWIKSGMDVKCIYDRYILPLVDSLELRQTSTYFMETGYHKFVVLYDVAQGLEIMIDAYNYVNFRWLEFIQ